MPIVNLKDVSKGINADAMPEELGEGQWSAGMNVRFRDGFAERVRGMTQLFATPSVAPYHLASYVTPAGRYWVHAGLQKVYADDGATRTEITPAAGSFTGAVLDRWSSGSLGGVLVMNNGKDIPVYWGGSTATKLQTLPGWDANHRCACLVPFKNYLVALDVTKSGTRYPNMVKWSFAAVPGSIPSGWNTADATQDAGELDIAETPDLLVGALPLGDVLVIYKERSMFIMRQSFDKFIFTVQRLPGTEGMLARGCVADTPVGHVVLTNGDVIVHQGQGPKSIVEGRMRRWLFDKMDPTRRSRSFVVTNPKFAEVWICFPSYGALDCDTALVWNWNDDTLTVRQINAVTHGAVGQLSASADLNTWAADTGAWQDDITKWSETEYAPNEAVLLLTRSAPMIVATETSGTDFGNRIQASLERRGMSFGDEYGVKLMRSVLPRMASVSGAAVNIEGGAAQTASASANWQPAQPFVIGMDEKVDFFANGRFLALRFTSNSVQPWRMRSVGIDIAPMGRY